MRAFLLLTVLSMILFGANIDNYAKEMGFERDYNTALLKEKSQNKPLMKDDKD